ncbi:MAG: DUF2924 domain-containing protein [Gemmatimonadaceae bacterium]|nr:DUF2924 domain-containing protein [Gemmatimonadaceae bacterium]
MSPAWEYQSIPIDFDVFKALTAKLQSPDDTFNDVLRRDFGLPSSTREREDSGPRRPWAVDGVTFPHGTEFRRTFKGQMYTARVENGALVYDGTRYDTPSAAAMAITEVAANGWRFWNARRPGDSDFRRIYRLRSRSR